MARPQRLGRKYDSFTDKVMDYQIRKTELTRDNLAKKGADKFRGEYNALTQLKSDIKDNIETSLDGALFFSRFLEFASMPSTPNNSKQYPDLLKNDRVVEFRSLLQKNEGLKKTIQDETQKFMIEIFNHERMEKILTSIFFGESHKSNKSKQDQIQEKRYENYRIAMAELMLGHAITILQRRAGKFLSGELEKTREIVALVRKTI